MKFHLLHPGLIHFTVAAVVLGGLCEIGGLLAARRELERWGAQLLLVGLVSLVPAIASGYLAANTVAPPPAALPLLASHERNAWLVLGALVASQFWKAWHGGGLPPSHAIPYAVLLAIVVGLTLYGAWLGGQMVYEHGVGVA